MVSAIDVESAYRMILGRDPESPEVVAKVAQDFATLDELRTAFMASDEFRQTAPIWAARAMQPGGFGWDPIPVDVAVPPATLRLMLQRVEQSWSALGASEPFWSVLTHEEYRVENIAAHKTEFYESGRETVAAFSAAAARAGLDLTSFGTCLELGCGVGRLTIWLADIFRQVIACDISQSHLTAAQEELERRGSGNVELLLTNTVQILDTLPTFDAFVSMIVLQHNPPPVAAFLLNMLLGRLNPGGIAYFQIPSYRVGYRFDVAQYLETTRTDEMEMHVVPQKDLFAIFERCGCSVLELREDGWTGDQQFISNSFLLQKRV